MRKYKKETGHLLKPFPVVKKSLPTWIYSRLVSGPLRLLSREGHLLPAKSDDLDFWDQSGREADSPKLSLSSTFVLCRHSLEHKIKCKIKYNKV